MLQRLDMRGESVRRRLRELLLGREPLFHRDALIGVDRAETRSLGGMRKSLAGEPGFPARLVRLTRTQGSHGIRRTEYRLVSQDRATTMCVEQPADERRPQRGAKRRTRQV